MAIPCECCPMGPLGLTGCWATPTPVANPPLSPIGNPTIVANPNGWGFSVASWADNNAAGPSFSGNTAGPGGGNTTYTGLVVDITYPTDVNHVKELGLWNNGGNILNDADGMGAFTFELFNAANVSVAGPFNVVGSNGGSLAPTNVYPIAAAPGLDGVRRIRITNMTSLSHGIPTNLVRLIALRLYSIRPAFALICDGELSWFDTQTGDPVDSSLIVSC